MPLPLQTGLDHRGGLALVSGPLFPPATTFAALGGREAVARLIDGLYDRIETDALLRPAFARNLAEEREKQKLFFEAWFGGDPGYFDAEWRHGLQVAHAAVSISRAMAARWVGHFLASLAEAARDPAIVNDLRPIVARLAMALVNRPDEPAAGERLRCSTTGVDPLFLQLLQRDDAAGIAAAAAPRSPVIRRKGPGLLLIAALRGKTGAAAELLRQGVDVNVPAMLPGSEAKAHGLPRLQITPLCGALVRGRDAVVELLVRHGAQYDIFTAASTGDLDASRQLLDRAPELADARDPACDVAPVTPLLHAVYFGQAGAARVLLKRGATVGANSVRLVRAAANQGHEELTQLLLEHGADAGSLGAGTWVLYPRIAEELLGRGADVNRKTESSWIGLCCTGNSGHRENAALARGFLSCGADVAARYGDRTALHCAAKAGFVKVVEALLEYGADVNALTDRGQTPLDVLEEAGKSVDIEPMRRLLLAHGARPGRR
jgi:ankyrin repeat protein/truncated hemoglobin YjbI